MNLTTEEYELIIDLLADAKPINPELLLKMALDWKNANSRECESCGKISPHPLIKLCRDC